MSFNNMFFSFKNSRPLTFIITGFEHSGTTLISEIMRQHPRIDSGFEGGILLCDKISQFSELEPFATNFRKAWQIEDSAFEEICRSRSYAEAYTRIRTASGVIPNKNTDLFDKTPRYLQRFSQVLTRVPDVKVVVIVRDMRSIIDSTFRRSKKELPEWMENDYPLTLRHTRSYLDGLTAALKKRKFRKRILVIRYEELILNQEEVAKQVYDHLGYEFKKEYLSFNEVKYRHVYGNDIQDKYIYKYRENLSPEIQEKIIEDFSPYENYFWSES